MANKLRNQQGNERIVVSSSLPTTPTTNAPKSVKGGMVKAVHVRRDMKIYGITENEIDGLSLLNGFATFFFSASSFCLSSIVTSIVVEKLFVSDNKNPDIGILLGIGIVATLVFAGLGIFSLCKRCAIISIIEKESIPE